jgi:hypothetical protein
VRTTTRLLALRRIPVPVQHAGVPVRILAQCHEKERQRQRRPRECAPAVAAARKAARRCMPWAYVQCDWQTTKECLEVITLVRDKDAFFEHYKR